MSHSPTYVSRLDPQFRRFVNVVNVYPSSDTSASNEDLSKDRGSSLAFNSCSDLNQEFITVDAYTEDIWPPTQGSQRQVSELFLEYATIISSESETSFANDNDIATCSSASPSSTDDTRILSNSEQRYSREGIRYDCFEGDSVFWSDVYDDTSDEEKTNEFLQRRLAVSNKSQPVQRSPNESFSSKADSERSCRFDSEPDGRLEHMEEALEFFDGKYFQERETIGPVSRHRGQEVISGYPQGTSRQIADSFDDLSSLGSELGYAPDVIEDGYSSTSSADSSFVYFALTGKQDVYRPKRKDARIEHRKKYGHGGRDSLKKRQEEGKDADQGLMACVVTGISGGPTVRVFRDQNSNVSTKSRSRSLGCQREETQPHSGRVDGGSPDQEGLKRPHFRYKSVKSSGHDSVFALIAAPGNSLVKDEQSSRREGNWGTERKARCGPEGADERVSAGFFENFRLNKPDSNLEGTTPTHLKTRVEKKRGSKDDDISSRRGDKYIREPIYAPVSSVNTSTKYGNVNVMPNAPANTASDFQQTRSDPITLSKENVQPSHSLEQTSSGPSVYNEPVEGGNQLFYSTWQNQFPEPTTTMIMRDAFQGTAFSVKVHSTIRAASRSAIRGSVSQGQRPKGNLEENEREKVGDTIAPTTFVSELRLTDAGKMSEEKYETWPSKEKNGINDQVVDLSELHVRETMDAQSPPSKPTTREAFGSYKDHKDRKTVRNLKPTAHNPNDKTRTTKDTSNEDCSGAVAKAELLTPVKTSILKTIKDCPLDTNGSDGDWKMGSMEEDQVCPNITRDESVRTESKGYVDVVEDQKARVRHVEITDGHQTEPGSIRFTEIKGLKKISLKKRVDASSDKTEGVASTANVDVIGTTEVDECNQENKVKGINQSTSAIYDTREPPVEERCDVLHTTKDRITDSNEREIDKKRSVDDVSQGPLSRTIQQQTHTPVIEDKLRKYRSTERKGVLNSLPKHHEKPSKLTGDLRIVSTVSGPYLWRRSSDTAHENLTKAADSPLRTPTGKESERYYKTEREAEQVFEEGHRCRSMDKIIRSNDVDDGNNNSLETVNGNNGYSLVPVFKRKVDEAFGEEESLKKKVEIITSCELSRREDEVEESTRKAEVMDENFEKSLNVTDERSTTQICKTDSKHYGEGVSLESSAPASMESHSIPETEGNRISKKTRFSKTSRRQLEVFTNNGGFGSQLRGNLSDPRRPREIDPWRGSRNTKQEGLESIVENKAKESRIDVIAAGKRRKEDGKKTHLPLNSEETSLVLLAGVTVAQGNSQIRNESKNVTSVPELKGKRHITPGLSSENQETAASSEPDRPLDMESHGEDETFAEKTPETTSSSVLQSAEDMKNGDVKKNEQHGRPMMASPLFERFSEDSNLDGVISQEALSNNLCTSLKEVKNGNQRYSRNTNTLKGDSNVSAVDIKLSTAHEEISFHEKANEHFTQQPSALTTFSDKETSGVQMVLDTSKKIFEMGKRDSCHGADRTDFPLEKDGQFLILKGDSAGHRRGLAVTPQTAEEHGITEDICFVAFDANSNAPEIGALPTTELVFSRNLDETADFLDHKAASPDKSNEAAVAESEIHSEVARLVKVGEVDSNSKTAICKTEVEEVVCRYEEGDSLLLSVNRVEPTKIRQAYSDGNYLIFGDEKLISNLSIGAQDPRTRRHEGDVQKTVSKATAGTVDTHTGKSKGGGLESVGGKRTLSSSQAPNETFLSLQSKANRKDNTEVTHGGASCRMSIHCDCLQEYLLHNGKGTEEIQRPVASANLEKLDANANMVFHTGTKRFDAFPGHRSGVKEYADKNCQVALLDDSTKPDYQTRESQTSFSYKSLNAEYQTNEVIEVSSQEKALQQQSVQCQTELQTIASVGVQVKVPDQHAEDKNLQRETRLVEEGKKGVQSLRTSRFPVNDDKVMQDVTESSHGVSFDSKECQTSGNRFYELEETGTSTSEDVSCRLIILESKECQTSLNTLLVTSSTQCEVITAHNGTDDLTVTTVAASRADKDCQALPNSAPLQATSKECQTLLWPCASDKNEKVSAETEMSYESKECQTLLDRDFVRATLEELQTSSFHYPFDETKKESKECQTLLEADHIEALFQDIAKPSEEESEKYYETKESQTYLDPGLFVASKECQTPTWSHTFQEAGVDTKISYDSKECQTLLECNLLLGTSKYCQTSSSYSCGEVGLQTEEIDISYLSKECQTTLDSDLPFATSKHCQTSSYSCGREVGLQTDEIDIYHHSKGCQTIVDSKVLLATWKECQTSWFSAAEETTRLGEEVEIVHLSRECQTEIGPLSSHCKECQTTPEFDADGPLKILSEFESHQHDYVTFDSKECQTDPVLMNGHLLENGNKPADSFEVNKQTHETKDTQTTTSVWSSKFCQTSSLRSGTDYRSRESQTIPEGDVFLSSSKECQTFPYSLQELKLLIAQVTAPKDVGLLSDAEADEYSNSTYPAPVGPLQATSRPSTYGESPDVLEESVTVFTSRDDRNDGGVCQANVELAHKSSAVPVDFAEIGCQAVLCHCGKFVDEHENDSSCSSDPQSGAAMRVSEGMQKEQASLIKQLDILRDMNQKLRDDKDAIEAAHEAKKNKVPRQGSQMSKYVKRRRNPSPEDTWGNQGLVESLSGDDVDGSSDRRSVSLHGSIQEEDEAEFEGDPTLEIISYEKAEEMEQPAWAKKIMSVVQPREVAAEEDQRMTVSDEELEEDVFRTRKAELISRGPGRGRLKEVREESDMSFSEELSDENGSASDERPPSPRGAPVGKDNEMCRVGSQDMSEAGVSAISEPSAPERVFKVVFVGDSGVGKSSFIHRFCHDAWKPSFTATIGVDFQIKTVNIDGRCIALQLWDTAGQERFRSITKQYFRKADGVIVFYDVTMETSFLNIKNWMISVEEGTDDGTAIMIVGNKTDLIEEDSERPVRIEDGKRLAEEYKALYTETSAKTGFNIQESMAEFSKMLQVREDELMQSVLNLVHDKPTKKKCCK